MFSPILIFAGVLIVNSFIKDLFNFLYMIRCSSAASAYKGWIIFQNPFNNLFIIIRRNARSYYIIGIFAASAIHICAPVEIQLLSAYKCKERFRSYAVEPYC